MPNYMDQEEQQTEEEHAYYRRPAPLVQPLSLSPSIHPLTLIIPTRIHRYIWEDELMDADEHAALQAKADEAAKDPEGKKKKSKAGKAGVALAFAQD